MPGMDAWCALADEVVAHTGADLTQPATDALVAMGLTDEERAQLSMLIENRRDPAGLILFTVATMASRVDPSPVVVVPSSPAQMDAALARARDLVAGGADDLAGRLAGVPATGLSGLPPEDAGSLVAELVRAAIAAPRPQERTALLGAVRDVTRRLDTARLPIAVLMSRAVTADLPEADMAIIAELLATAPRPRLLSGTLDALRQGVAAERVLALLQHAAVVARARWETASVTRPVPPPSVTPPPPAGPIWRGVGHRAVTPPPPSPPTQPGPSAPPTTAGPPAERAAYPRIDVQASGVGRPDIVVFDEPFAVTVGLTKYRDAAITQAGPMTFLPASVVDLELVLVYDPNSLTAQGSTRFTLTVSDVAPYPTATVSFIALYRPDLPRERRIGVHYLRDGQVVGIAWKTLLAVAPGTDVAGVTVPDHEPDGLLDLEPLLGVDLPDLILSICASDGAATGEFVWTAYAGASDVTVPDAPRVSTIDGDSGLQGFVTEMRQAVAFSQGPYGDYLTLVGKARRMGRAVPDGIQEVLRAVVEDPTRTSAATVLLLTEELTLPWELVVFDQPLDTVWGGIAPFLGAHAAIARWPLTQHKPRPTPRASVTVRRAAVLTADYTGVSGWGKLEHALEEATQIAALFAPPAVTVRPSLRDVVSMLRGTPPADVLHVALHGQFDAKGGQEGLVLLGTDAAGQPTAKWQFFTPDQVENGQLDGGPFVFLNACQVASDKRVLGDYGGFASTLLRIGASSVVAPLWNVDDDVAAQFARDFYAATWTQPAAGAAPTVSAAEAVRAARARYTEAAAEAQTPGVTATLVAFQVFGHPRLRLDRGA